MNLEIEAEIRGCEAQLYSAMLNSEAAASAQWFNCAIAVDVVTHYQINPSFFATSSTGIPRSPV